MNSFSSSTRRLRRLYSNQDLSSAGEVVLSPEESQHALRSLRLQPGERCLITNGDGWEAEASFQLSSEAGAIFKIHQACRISRGFSMPVTVLPALIKKGKMDTLVEKAQEFGASFFQPIVCERSEFEISADRFEAVALRWKKIAQEAAKQSGASQTLEIKAPVHFQNKLTQINRDALVLVFHPRFPAQDWVQAANETKARKSVFSEISVWVGPEGGFSEHEIEKIQSLNHPHLYFVSMGQTVLKADTAFIAALAGVSFFI